MSFLKSMLSDGENGSWSSKRIITFLAFIFCSVAFFASIFFEKKVDSALFDGMMYVVLTGLGVTVTEKFASKFSQPTQIHFHEPINNKRTYGTPLPRIEEKEI
jgi:hypothetical protein